MHEITESVLGPYRVLDLADEKGLLCGKILGDLRADVIKIETPGGDPEGAAAMISPWVEAGATWWIEAMWDAASQPDGLQAVLKRIRQGPPRRE